jgi:hypothetical protein
MSEREVGHYFVVRYMYNELGDEAANIGVIFAGRYPKSVKSQFLPELKVKDRADVQMDKGVVDDFRTWLDREVFELPQRGGVDWFSQFETRLREKTGNIIRILGPRSVLTSDDSAELRTLYNEWVAPRPKRHGERTGVNPVRH